MTTSAIETTARMLALGTDLETHGMNADPVNLLLVAHTAADLGVPTVLIDVMINEDEPEVARMRAFAKVSSAIVARIPTTLPDPEHKVLQAA